MLTGHPKGLYRLFFIEMWERLAFYTMVGILFLYTIDKEQGGLGLPRSVGSEIYGLYLAFVYFTPYLGGIIADRYLGYRKAVLIGGAFFASGFFLMSAGYSWSFITGLVFLCIGNGFFKPNISAMVGNLYESGDPKRDAGFSIFYMGINVGAFAANFLAALMRNEYGWLAIFLAAGFGMLIGITVLLASWKVLEKADRVPGTNPEDTPFSEIAGKILLPALVSGVIGYLVAFYLLPEAVTKLVRPSDIGFLVGAVPIILFFVRLPNRASDAEKPGLAALLPIYVAGATFFMVLHLNGSAMTVWANDNTDRDAPWVAENLPFFAGDAFPSYYKNARDGLPRPAKEMILPIVDEDRANMFGQQRMDEEGLAAVKANLPAGVRVEQLPLDKKEYNDQQKGWSSLAVDVFKEVKLKRTPDSHGKLEITVKVADDESPIERVAFVRDGDAGTEPYATYLVTQKTYDVVYRASTSPQLPPGKFLPTANAELYQSFNPLFVILFTPLLVGFFALLQGRAVDFSTARKIFAGMVITALAVLLMAVAGFTSEDGAVKVSLWWLVSFYAIVTVGELCLSPMALSLVTKLSPKRFVGLTMGGWFFATSVGNKFSGFLGGLQSKMPPSYFFLSISIAVGVVAFGIFLLLPRLDKAIKQYGA